VSVVRTNSAALATDKQKTQDGMFNLTKTVFRDVEEEVQKPHRPLRQSFPPNDHLKHRKRRS